MVGQHNAAPVNLGKTNTDGPLRRRHEIYQKIQTVASRPINILHIPEVVWSVDDDDVLTFIRRYENNIEVSLLRLMKPRTRMHQTAPAH